MRWTVPVPFPANTVDLMRTFAAQSVLAIQNARLFHEIEDKGHQIEAASKHKSGSRKRNCKKSRRQGARGS